MFGDTHGSLVHLGERECSIQRRHQKVIEESPSPGTEPATRERMLAAAVAPRAGRWATSAPAPSSSSSSVQGPTQEFFFLEMNTRLQVEHPVTEAVTGLDLVALQLRVAQGLPLGFTQDDVRIDGHAVEVRVYAEDPSADHRPSTGTLLRWDEAAGVRWDSGVEAGDEVSTHYDPMLAKVVAHAASREEAVASLARALRTSALHGVVTNTASLVAVLESPDFRAGDDPDRLPRPPPGGARGRPRRPRSHVPTWRRPWRTVSSDRRRTAPVLAFAPSGWRNVARGAADDRVQRGGTSRSGEPTSSGRTATWTSPSERSGCAVGSRRRSAGVVDLEVDGLRASYAVTVAGGSDESSPTEVWVTGQGWTSRFVESAAVPGRRDRAAALVR